MMNTQNRAVFNVTCDLGHLEQVEIPLWNHLKSQKSFCLWLIGDLGAGKTTLTRRLLERFGLSSTTPVVSPTFTYMNEYKGGNDWFAHLDFYRTNPATSCEDLSIYPLRPYRGTFVEWPENIAPEPWLTPSFRLEIHIPDSAQSVASNREYHLYRTP